MAEKKANIDKKRIDERNRSAVKGLIAMYPNIAKGAGGSSGKGVAKGASKGNKKK